jgi:hypothetical protein
MEGLTRQIDMQKLIQKTAFAMFRDWSKKASRYFPKMDFTIIDETKLVNELQESINSAVRSLFDPEYNEDRKIQGWSTGFICGFIQSNLGGIWYYEYVIKQTETYRNFIAIKAILEYLKVDTDLGIRFDSLYKELFKDANLDNLEISPKIDVDFLSRFGLQPATPQNRLVAQSLESLSVRLLKEMAEEESFNGFKTEKYLTKEDIQLIIESRPNEENME